VKTLLPLYVHPLADPAAWATAAGLGDAVLVVVNVHNGPGEQTEPAYDEVTGRLATGGVPMLGYVDLDYGRRGGSSARRDIARWQRYPVSGVFFDRVPSGTADFSSVARVADAVAGLVALNPGTRPAPSYVDVAELVCTFEGSWSAYLAEDTEPDETHAAHLVYGVPAGRLAEARARVARRVRCGLVTDLDLPLPYLGLPTGLDR
jgi:hypothetical protein